MTWSFFDRLPYDLSTLESYRFFLVYHGKGYTVDDVGKMTFDQMLGHVQRLHKQLMDEKEAAEERARMSRMKSKR